MVLLFLHDLSVPFTNNESEQGLRMPTVREKVSGCFRTEKGMENYCESSGLSPKLGENTDGELWKP